MSCDEASGLISEYLDGCLAKPALVEFERHIYECDRCSAELRATQDMIASLRSLSERGTPVDCWFHVRGCIAAGVRVESLWRYWLMRPMMAAPALAVMLLLALLFVWPAFAPNQPARDIVSVPEYGHYIAAHSGAQRQRTFADPDVTFIAAELEKAGSFSDPAKP